MKRVILVLAFIGIFFSCGKNMQEAETQVSSVSLNQSSAALVIGESVQLTATVHPSSAAEKIIVWSTSKASVATVNAGRVTAVDEGTATITASAGGKSATCSVTVSKGVVSVTSISINKADLALVEGESETLVATVMPEEATDKTVTWNSSNSMVASINNGIVTGIMRGYTTITVTAKDGSGVFAKCNVVVNAFEPAKEVIIAVELGLSVKWGSVNLGASTPEERGEYYAWGETEPKSNYSWSTYTFGHGMSGPFSKYNTDKSYGAVDNRTVLESADDVASKKLGGDWRMPTAAEWAELKEKCTWTWTYNYNGTGVNGRIVTGSKGNSIFLPAAGYRTSLYNYNPDIDGKYWSSSLDTAEPYRAWDCRFDPDKVFTDEVGDFRYEGYSVRPVSK